VTQALRRVAAEWLNEAPLGDLLAVLDSTGEEARVVGGAVRNALLGLPLGDIDVATTAPPSEVTHRAQTAGFKVVPTGIEHGTVTVVADKRAFEVTTLREDVETFGRHAKVAFGRDWKHDAERRDFTINALSVSRDGTVHDYVGGLADIDARRVRFIGDPAQRIAEDYLRILRFFRFHAAYGDGEPDPEGVAACIAARAGLDGLSRERIRMEVMQLLVAKRATATLAAMAEAGLLEQVLGTVPLLASLANLVKLETELALAPDAVRRLAALAVSVTEDAERLRERLRLANVEYECLISMADQWRNVSPQAPEQDGRALLYRLGRERFVDRVLFAWARSSEGAADEHWRALVTLPQRWSAPTFPLKAADLIARGVAKGPRLGTALAVAEEAWIAADFPVDPAAVNAIAEAAARAN
jgi:poly(A) polymerase